jgi:hypothetical protein
MAYSFTTRGYRMPNNAIIAIHLYKIIIKKMNGGKAMT